MKQSPVVMLNESIGSWHMTSETTQLEQVFRARYDVLDGIDMTLMPDPDEIVQPFRAKQICSDTLVELIDRRNDRVLYSGIVSGGQLDGATEIHLDMGGVRLSKGEEYGVRFTSLGNGIKDAMIAAKPEDVRIVKSPVGMPGRALNSPLIQKLARGGRIAPPSCMRCIVTCDPGKTPYCITRALIEAVRGNWEDGLFFCGGNVGRVDRMRHVSELIDELMTEWRNA